MAQALHLEVGADHLATLTFDLPGKKANIFTREVMAELETLLTTLAQRNDIGCLVLVSTKPGMFIAGADVAEIAGVIDPDQAEAGSRYGHRLFSAWENLPFPTVSAISGTCLGGGTELSLASTYIVVSDRSDLRVGLPETKLGILPGWGGCVRLPRRIGAVAALDLILAGKSFTARQALKAGLADAILPDAGFFHHVRDFARARIGRKRPHRRAPGGIRRLILEGNPAGRWFVFDQARKKTLASTHGRYPAPLAAIAVIRTGIERGAGAGFDAEAIAVRTLATSTTAKNLIHLFGLMEASKRDARPAGGEAASDAAVAEVRQVAVLGAGVMGGGIAHLIADRTGLPVRVKDIQAGALSTALQHAAKLFDKQVRRRRLKPAEARRKMALLQPTLEDEGLSGSDLVIEAVVENLAVKQKIFAALSQRLSPSALLASNTSSLSIDAIGVDAAHRERVVGLHFFNPVDKMPLVEVVAGTATGEAAIRAASGFARRLGKTPVVVRDGPGFLVNRLLAFYSAEAMWLLDEGHRVEAIDRAMVDWGMPMGPLRLADEVGLDVSVKVGHILHEAFPDRLLFPAWTEKLADDARRLGVKTGKGIYRYENGREREADPAIYPILGIVPKTGLPLPPAERMVLPMVNEAARCLAEGIVEGPGPLDLALIFGTGFPPFRGGLCRWADGEGLDAIVARLEQLAQESGSHHAPSDSLRDFARRGGFYPAAAKPSAR
ncbi:MAG: 3-hydroxyacyl-CoA dehydrogenase NAD-binding domain-containing protein [Thermoanaerobaculia bacterium]